jgi:hypothetical protein
MIAEGLGKHEQARSDLKEALTINPHFHPIFAEAAQQSLAVLEEQTKSESGSNQHGR